MIKVIFSLWLVLWWHLFFFDPLTTLQLLLMVKQKTNRLCFLLKTKLLSRIIKTTELKKVIRHSSCSSSIRGIVRKTCVQAKLHLYIFFIAHLTPIVWIYFATHSQSSCQNKQHFSSLCTPHLFRIQCHCFNYVQYITKGRKLLSAYSLEYFQSVI